MTLLNLSKVILLATSLSALSLATTAKPADIYITNKVHKGERHQNMHQKMMHKRFKHMAKELNLTKEQRQQVREIFKDAKAQKETHQPMMATFHQAMQTLLTASTFDEQAILALKANYKSTFEQLELIKAKSRYDIFALLTTEQKDKWRLMQEKRMAHRQADTE